MPDSESKSYHFSSFNISEILSNLGKPILSEVLTKMLLIRQFEMRGEAAYQQGKVGGFFHSYIGQEAIQTALIQAIGKDHWFTTTYRCHALALLLGATPNELMAELYGRATGNAKGRGGSMHFYADRLLGGFGIVGGQIPIATGAAFTIKYKNQKGPISVCFLGDGAVAQGTFHESLNMAALWGLPCLYVIENNQWSMGTSVKRGISVPLLAEDKGPAYGIKAYTFNGMDFFNCYAGFTHVYNEMLETGRPVLVEVIAERFRGHSISDPGLYRSKDDLKECIQKDPIQYLLSVLIEAGYMTQEEYDIREKEQREVVLRAMKYAEESPWPEINTLEQDVFAP